IKLSAIPNPFSSETRISCTDCVGIQRLIVLDLAGRTVHSQLVEGTNWTLYKGTLSPGTYVVEVSSVKSGQSARMKVTVY
ncbi:MAG: T9SS type A sorting domain-containing protein, partial [Bacteroidota bacterium]